MYYFEVVFGPEKNKDNTTSLKTDSFLHILKKESLTPGLRQINVGYFDKTVLQLLNHVSPF